MRGRPIRSRLIAPFLCVPLLTAAAAGAEGLSPGSAARYIVFEIGEDGAVRPQMHRIVRLASPQRSLSSDETRDRLAAVSRDEEAVLVRMYDGSGGLAFEDVVDVPRWIRAESALEDSGVGEMDARRFVSAKRSFAVRVPVLERSWLGLSVSRGSDASGDAAYRAGAFREAQFDLDALAVDASLPLARFAPEVEQRSAAAANSGNRVDILVMGDGYMSSERTKFDADTSNLVANFFGLGPYSAYRSFFNTATLFTASAQSGADHPPFNASCSPSLFQQCCADTTAQTDAKAGTFVNTAFDSTFCSNNLHRALVLDTNKVLAAAAAVPDWDKILTLVNDPTYGGTGGVVGVISTHPLAVNVAQHEFGHSFTGLADEYDSAFPTYPACSDKSGTAACEPNVTDQTDRSKTKWGPWISGSTPIPTPETAAFTNIVGLFEGARYLTTGMFRPRQNCLMNQLGQPFCQICAQAFVLRLYRGGWGKPAGGIDNIEPGSENPSTASVVTMPFPGSKNFSVGLLTPTGGSLSTTWFVDGTSVPGVTSSVFNYSPATAGTHQVKVRVKDTTNLVNATTAGGSLEHERSWTVTAGSGGGQRFLIDVDWAVPAQNRSGEGTEVPLTADTRYFWFFTPSNVELVIKVLDARGVNGHFWVFYGALSSVQYTIHITDTVTGQTKTYNNPSGTLASVADVEAFEGVSSGPSGLAAPDVADLQWALAAQAEAGFAPGAPAMTFVPPAPDAPASTCALDPRTLCLSGSRFQVRVDWAVPAQNRSGTGTAVPVTSDTGYFWFFTNTNVELIVKVLDAQAVNGHFWIFYGALSSVQYKITVTDTETGAVKTYQNPNGTLASVADTSAF